MTHKQRKQRKYLNRKKRMVQLKVALFRAYKEMADLTFKCMAKPSLNLRISQ